MYASEIFVLQLILLFFALYVQAERVMRPKFKDTTIWSDNYYIKHEVTFDENDPHMNITMHVLRELNDVDIYIHNSVTHKDDVNHYMTFNATFSLCRLISWRDQSPIGNLMYSYVKEHGKLAETCPIPKGTETFHILLNRHLQGKYYLHKFWLPEDPSTALLPEVYFDTTIKSYHVDEQKKRTLMTENHFTGEAVVMEVNKLKRNMLSMLPMAG